MQIIGTRDQTREEWEQAVLFPSSSKVRLSSEGWGMSLLQISPFFGILTIYTTSALNPYRKTRPCSLSQWSHLSNLLIIINVLRWILGPLPSFLDTERALKLLWAPYKIFPLLAVIIQQWKCVWLCFLKSYSNGNGGGHKETWQAIRLLCTCNTILCFVLICSYGLGDGAHSTK